MSEATRERGRDTLIAMSALLIVTFIVMVGVGITVKLETWKRHQSQLNKSTFVRTHACVVTYIGKRHYVYDAENNTIREVRGFKSYSCPEQGVTILIDDDEVQP